MSWPAKSLIHQTVAGHHHAVTAVRLREVTRRQCLEMKNSGTCGHFAAGAFVPWIVRVVARRVVVTRITGRARGDPFLQLFYFEQNVVFHLDHLLSTLE